MIALQVPNDGPPAGTLIPKSETNVAAEDLGPGHASFSVLSTRTPAVPIEDCRRSR